MRLFIEFVNEMTNFQLVRPYTYRVVIPVHGMGPSFNIYLINKFLTHRKLCVFITKTKQFMLLGHTITTADEKQEKTMCVNKVLNCSW
jgi:hypothetical protein